MDWYLIRTKPREEWRAKQHLENQHYSIYLPILTRKQGKQEPLFPGYIFLANGKSDQSVHTIRSTRGVLGFVRFGTQLALVNDGMIEELKVLESNYQEVPRFVSGQRVEVCNGAFAGLEAIFQVEDGLDRCVILLKILNAERSISIDQADLKVM